MKKNLLPLTAVIFILLYLFSFFSEKKQHTDYHLMIEAANKMNYISSSILEEKIKRGIDVDKALDINLTGLIGEEYTEITTTLGNLESKRTSTNPDFAALFVKLLKEKGLKKGDKVAVNMSSSFPALNLSLIVALDLLELEGVLINSVGASTYGANSVDFTYLDMEDFLLEQNLITNHSRARSLGGDNDLGDNFQQNYKEILLIKKDKKNRKFFHIADHDHNLKKRMDYYHSHGNIKLFISIGGNLLAERLESAFKKQGIDSLSFLNIKSIASKHGIPIDPIPLPEIGTTSLYQLRQISFTELLIVFLFMIYLIYLKKNQN